MTTDDLPLTRLFINGEHRAAADGATYDVTSPIERRVTGRGANASAADCAAAVEAAAAALPAWEATPAVERAAILYRAADCMQAARERVHATIRAESGASAAWADFQLAGAVGMLRAAAGMKSELYGRSYQSGFIRGAHVLEQRRALGVVFSIAPWNAPNVLTTRALAVPFLCGNTIVLKGSEYTPATIKIVVDAFVEAGAPPGTINYITTATHDSAARCAEIIAHPAVKKLTFTGSDTVGRSLAMECARHLKPAVLELGGKSAAVVLADADIARAARVIVHGALVNSGQVCMATERVVVERAAAPALREAVRTEMAAVEAAGTVAPLFTERSAQGVLALIADATAAGAQIAHGDGARDGAYVRPHLLTGVPESSRLWQRESFGPVISFVEADNAADAVRLANASDYTLTAALFTRNVDAAFKLASELIASCVVINGSTVHPEPGGCEMGLTGTSGYGHFDIDAFTHRRSVMIVPEGAQIPPMV